MERFEDWQIMRTQTAGDLGNTVTLEHSQEAGAWRICVNSVKVGAHSILEPTHAMFGFWLAVEAILAAD